MYKVLLTTFEIITLAYVLDSKAFTVVIDSHSNSVTQDTWLMLRLLLPVF